MKDRYCPDCGNKLAKIDFNVVGKLANPKGLIQYQCSKCGHYWCSCKDNKTLWERFEATKLTGIIEESLKS
jgi:hypothetical protein